MVPNELKPTRATPHDARSEGEPTDGGLETLQPYFREIGPLETLTAEQELALARNIERHTLALRREVFGIPLAARLVVERWNELQRANRRTAGLSALPAERRPPDASARRPRGGVP